MVKYLSKEDNFDDLVKTGKVIVDFYADWCGPCKMLGPILEELEGIEIIKVNTDEFPTLATKFGIMSIPTLLFYQDGEVKVKKIGLMPKEEIEEIISNL